MKRNPKRRIKQHSNPVIVTDPLAAKPIAFLDVETTGVNPYRDRIIEIGIVKVINGEVQGSYSKLIQPGIAIPQFISGLTGISDTDLQGMPKFSEVADELLDFLAGCTIVAHNAQFDISFLSAELGRCQKSVTLDYACSVKLSRRLYPHERRHGLDYIISRLQLQVKNRHRALDDATVIHHFLQQAATEFSAELVMAALNQLTRQLKAQAPVEHDTADSLPSGPGVYIFEDNGGKPLYIGKSINIRKRIQTHLHSSSPFSTQYSNIRTIETAGELGALLREALLIKTQIPLYNRLLRNNRGLLILEKSYNEQGFLQVKAREVPDLAAAEFGRFFGVFSSRKQLERVLAAKSRQFGLCHRFLGLDHGSGPCFAHQLHMCSGACAGKIPATEHNRNMEEAMQEFIMADWQWQGPILLSETGKAGTESFLVDQWCLLGSNTALLDASNEGELNYHFDYDIYKILRRGVRKQGGLEIKELGQEALPEMSWYFPVTGSHTLMLL